MPALLHIGMYLIFSEPLKLHKFKKILRTYKAEKRKYTYVHLLLGFTSYGYFPSTPSNVVQTG